MYLDMLEKVHGNGRDQHGFSVVILEDKNHVEILDVELDAFEVDQLHLVESDDERRPFGEVDETSAGRLKLASRTEWNAGEAELLERRVKVHIALGDALHFLRESLKRRSQSCSKLTLSLKTEQWPLNSNFHEETNKKQGKTQRKIQKKISKNFQKKFLKKIFPKKPTSHLDYKIQCHWSNTWYLK